MKTPAPQKYIISSNFRSTKKLNASAERSFNLSRSTNFQKNGQGSFDSRKPLTAAYDVKSDGAIKDFYNSIDKASFGAPREIFNKVVGPGGYSF